MLTIAMKEWFISKLQEKAGILMPVMFKRLMYISSLLAMIDGNKNSDEALACKLNAIFDLTHDPKSVVATMRIKNVIWKDLEQNKTFIYCGKIIDLDNLQIDNHTSMDLELIANHVISKTPDWIRYASDNVMRYDIKKLLRNLSTLRTA
jgi:hypothetical protein